jgi:hypothetical protein
MHRVWHALCYGAGATQNLFSLFLSAPTNREIQACAEISRESSESWRAAFGCAA